MIPFNEHTLNESSAPPCHTLIVEADNILPASTTSSKTTGNELRYYYNIDDSKRMEINYNAHNGQISSDDENEAIQSLIKRDSNN
jgi:hypothetical protein